MVCETHLGYVHGLGGREKRFLLKLLAAYRLERAQIQYNEIQCAFRFVFS